MQLLTEEIEKKAKMFPLYSQDGKKGDAIVIARYFTPWSNYVWYVLEIEDETAFGYIVGPEPEFGYFNIIDLQNMKQEVSVFGKPVEMDAVELDASVIPCEKTLGELLEEHNEPTPSYWNEENNLES
ncbi:MAG: DUF2958 domain-containing protein [Fibrobacter sp.]|nr:DUF2958 domain-containing protein [Fibrobacter sp.]